jgi:hypothetical protein
VGVSGVAHYADVRPSLGIVWFGPGRAVLVDEGGAANDAMGIGKGIGVVVQEAGLLGVGVFFGKLDSGQRDGGCVGLGYFAALEEPWVDVRKGH